MNRPLHLCLAIAALTVLSGPAAADRIANGVAQFAALDKVTARISELEVPIDQTVEFGALKVTPRVCYSRPPTERPKTTTFVEIEQIELDGSTSKLFSGWMFAESPALNALEHPVFDVWLTGCKAPTSDVAAAAKSDEAGVAEVPAPQSATPFPRRRIRR